MGTKASGVMPARTRLSRGAPWLTRASAAALVRPHQQRFKAARTGLGHRNTQFFAHDRLRGGAADRG
jgi:hypothetical protein